MGADIAIWAASRGFYVSLQDRSPEILAPRREEGHGFYKKKLKQPRLVQEAMDRLMPDLNGDGLARADLVIEAIIEKVEAKRELFAQVEARVRPEALLASNTSSIPLETRQVAQGSDPSGRLHFFNPVAQMQLVEIVRGAQSSEAALNRARGFTAALDRLPLDVKSSPGFLVNRVLMPYLIEAVMLAEEGQSLANIDGAALDFGMPMGRSCWPTPSVSTSVCRSRRNWPVARHPRAATSARQGRGRTSRQEERPGLLHLRQEGPAGGSPQAHLDTRAGDRAPDSAHGERVGGLPA